MTKKYPSKNQLRNAKLLFQQELKKIPKENKSKFFNDLMKLIQYAQKDNYENYNLE